MIKQNILNYDSLINKTFIKRIQYWSQTGSLRKTSFIHALARTGWLYSGGRRIENANEFCNVIDSIITVMNRVHENNWDIHLTPIFHSNGKFKYFKLEIKILFPEITITNSNGNSHTIKDLIFAFELRKSDVTNSYYPSEFRGTRATLNEYEWRQGYYHSHLPTIKPTSFHDTLYLNSFCTGSNTEINNVSVGMNEEGYSEELFELFLHTVDTVVSWESLEGNPYKYIDQLTTNTDRQYNVSNTIHESILISMFNTLKISFEDYVFNYMYINDKFEVKKDNQFINFLKQNIIDCNERSIIRNLIVKRIQGIYFGFTENVIGISDHNFIEDIHDEGEKIPYTVIQGRKIYFKLITPETEETTNSIDSYTVHENFIDYAANKLNEKLYYKAVRKSAIERAN